MSENERPEQTPVGYTENNEVPPQTNVEAAQPLAPELPDQQHGNAARRPTLDRHQEAVDRSREVESLLPLPPPAPVAIQGSDLARVTSSIGAETERASKPLAEASITFDQATHEQTIVEGLLAIFASIREEVRSYRVLLFSNLILGFTIPLSAIAVQDRKVFKAEWLGIFHHPSWWLFACWLLGVLSMVAGLYFILPNIRKGSEFLTVYRAKEAAAALVAKQIEAAIKSLNEAIEKEDERLKTTSYSRWPFILTFILFLACVTFEFALVLFAPIS